MTLPTTDAGQAALAPSPADAGHAAVTPPPTDAGQAPTPPLPGASEESSPSTPDRVLVLDGAVVGLVSVAICVAADRLLFMSVFVPLVLLARLVAWKRLRLGPILPELAFLLICTLIGAFNDWNTVDRHGVYEYTVPVYQHAISSIPLWMLLYWGLILRFIASLAWSARLGPTPARRHPARLLIMLALVLATRQAIFRWYDDPWLSWLPFAAAGLAWWHLLKPDAHDRRLAALAIVAGTATEAIYIQIGGLHHYGLGVLGGVPLWIILWWPIAVLVWKELVGYRPVAWPRSTPIPTSPGTTAPMTSATSTPAARSPSTRESARSGAMK